MTPNTTPATELSPNIDKALVNLRASMRLVYEYQQHMLRIAEFIRKQTNFPEFKGAFWYSDGLYRSSRDYYNEREQYFVSIYPQMWAWDFLPSYSFEYYLGAKSVNCNNKKLTAHLSLLQISDDGSYVADFEKREHAHDIGSDDSPNPMAFDSPESSNSWLAFYVDIHSGKQPKLWLKESSSQPDDVDARSFVNKLFIEDHDQDAASQHWGDLQQQGEVTVFQKFKLQHFITHASTLETIATFHQTVLDLTGVDLQFK